MKRLQIAVYIRLFVGQVMGGFNPHQPPPEYATGVGNGYSGVPVRGDLLSGRVPLSVIRMKRVVGLLFNGFKVDGMLHAKCLVKML